MKDFLNIAVIVAVLFFSMKGGDEGVSPEPDPGRTAATAERAIRDYANGLASVWEQAANEGHDGPWIESQTKSARLEAFRSVNEIMAESFSPEELREAAKGARGALK